MTAKSKLYTVLALFLLLLLMAGFGVRHPGTAEGDASVERNVDSENDVIQLKDIKKLGGAECRMPENSAFVFWGSTLGTKLSSYTAYGSVDETLCALRTGEIDAMWACDVTADYLQKTNADIISLSEQEMSDIARAPGARFSFGMALRDDEESEQLRDDINAVMKVLRENGRYDILVDKYITNADKMEAETDGYKKYVLKDMKSVNQTGKTLYVGISGTVAPLELLDEDSDPYGFCVAYMDEIGAQLKRPVKFVVIDNETIFTSLMSGRIDLIMNYGTGNITTETKKNYIMTDGYYAMSDYKILVRSTR